MKKKRAGRFYFGPDATDTAADGWGQCGTVHFSCHGAADERFAPFSRLYLRDEVLMAHDVAFRRPPLRTGALVLLNGCETGVKDWRAVDEGMGLMSAFLLRGAGLVASTMWSVLDGCAALMVLDFVSGVIDRKLPPVEALAAAQANLRGLAAEPFLEKLAEVEKMFPKDRYPIEAAKLLGQKAWTLRRAGRYGESREAAETAVPLLRDRKMESAAQTLERYAERCRRPDRPTAGEGCFDHPVFWGAVQLIGRVV